VQYTKHTFIKEIFSFVFFVHVLLVMLLFVGGTSNPKKEKFVINSNNLSSTVVFLPLHKRVPQNKNSSQSTSLDQKRKVVSYDAYQKALQQKNKKHVKKTESKIEKKVVQAPAAKKQIDQKKQAVKVEKPVQKVKAATTLQHEKSKLKVQKKASKQVEVKKVLTQSEKKSLEKKSVEKKNSAIKAVEKVAVKAQEKKTEPVQDLKVDPVQEPEQPQAIEHVVELDSVLAAIVENDHTQDDTIDDDINLDDISFIGRDDLEKHEIQERIKLEIEKHWKAPIGIAKTAVCELAILVDIHGEVLQVTIQKSSGSLVYDMSCRSAVYQSQFPKEVYGKEFIIELGS